MRMWTLPSILFLLCLLFLLLPDHDEVVDPPKVEEKVGAVPHGLSTDSDVFKRKSLRGNAKKFEFQAEVSRFMNMIINSLYSSNKDIFLRELISDAYDALDEIRLLSLSEEGDYTMLEIEIKFDKENKILSVRDRGVGMTKKDMIKNLGTIVELTSAFIEKKQTGGDLIVMGQFGVGFYSVYLVADYVEVISKHNDDKQYVWKLNTDGAFAISDDRYNEPLGHGTEIRLHLSDQAWEYLQESKLKDLANNYTDFINIKVCH